MRSMKIHQYLNEQVTVSCHLGRLQGSIVDIGASTLLLELETGDKITVRCDDVTDITRGEHDA